MSVNCGSEVKGCRAEESGSVPGWARSIYQLCLPHLIIFLRVYRALAAAPHPVNPLVEKRQIVDG